MPTKLTLDTHVDNGLMYRVYQNRTARAELFLYCLRNEFHFSEVFRSVNYIRSRAK